MRGIYIHIPFCLRKCPYCDFYSVRLDEGLADKYIGALIRSFGAPKYKGLSADTVYIGGGTPTALSEDQITRLMGGVFEHFDIAKNAEITIEANPCTVDLGKLNAIRGTGINRISFGVQSANDRELGFLGRLHDYETAEAAILNAHRAGFDNISADIMLGLKGQDRDSLLASADRLTALPIGHISAYMLKIEPGTAFDNDKTRAEVCDDDTVSGLYLSLVERLEKRGFSQYEISNFAKAGLESRHNLKYWTGEEYVGFGPAAHSLFEGRRYYVPRDLSAYIAAPMQSEIDEEEPYNEREEYIMLALRLCQGLERARLTSLYGEDGERRIADKASLFEKSGLCRINDERIMLTPKGFLVSNSLILEFLSCVGLA